MKIVHDTQENIAKKVAAFIKAENKRPLSRKTCTIVAIKKGTHDTTIQTIKRAPYRVIETLKGAKVTMSKHLVDFYNPKAESKQNDELGAYRRVIRNNIISAKIDGVMYVAQQANPL
jgi:hypothetical protein